MRALNDSAVLLRELKELERAEQGEVWAWEQELLIEVLELAKLRRG